jgi:ferredoxin-NADP reductase
MRSRDLSSAPVAGLELEQTEVTGNKEIAPGIFRLTFPRAHDFVPGQTVALTVEPSLPARYYSIASGSRDAGIEILYDLVPEGLLTPRLARLAPGDRLLASKPFGAFRDGEGDAVWIAAGTGIAPFASMVRSGLHAGRTLIHGSRTLAGLYERSYFSSVLRERYVPCCSTESAPGVFRGRSTLWLSSHSLPRAERWMLCGSSRMVVDARDILIGRGVPFTSVVAEIYF